GRRRPTRLLRADVPDRARHRGRHAAGGARPPALPDGALAAGQRRAELPAGLFHQQPGGGGGGGARGGCGPRTPRGGRGGGGGVDGLRIDHPDGLSDPGGYLRRLRDAAPETWIVAEKILGVGESLPVSWPVAGTTGYDALREVCGLFIDSAGEPESPESLHD